MRSAILAAILLPTLKKAMSTARQIACGSQQRQIPRRDLIDAFGKRAWQMMTEGSGIANIHQEVPFELMLNIGMNLIQIIDSLAN